MNALPSTKLASAGDEQPFITHQTSFDLTFEPQLPHTPHTNPRSCETATTREQGKRLCGEGALRPLGHLLRPLRRPIATSNRSTHLANSSVLQSRWRLPRASSTRSLPNSCRVAPTHRHQDLLRCQLQHPGPPSSRSLMQQQCCLTSRSSPWRCVGCMRHAALPAIHQLTLVGVCFVYI